MHPSIPPIALTLLLGACDSDNWVIKFASFTGASTISGGAVIVISGTFEAEIGGDAQRLELQGEAETGPAILHVATQSDVAVLEHADRAILLSGILADPQLVLPGAIVTPQPGGATILELSIADTSLVDPVATGRGRLVVARAGSVLALEHRGGVIAYAQGSPPRFFGPGAELRLDGNLILVATDGRLETLVPPPPPLTGQRLARDGAALQLFGPRGETVASLPADDVELGGRPGLFLSALFPNGLSEDDRVPIELLMAEHNRYLVRIEG